MKLIIIFDKVLPNPETRMKNDTHTFFSLRRPHPWLKEYLTKLLVRYTHIWERTNWRTICTNSKLCSCVNFDLKQQMHWRKIIFSPKNSNFIMSKSESKISTAWWGREKNGCLKYNTKNEKKKSKQKLNWRLTSPELENTNSNH